MEIYYDVYASHGDFMHSVDDEVLASCEASIMGLGASYVERVVFDEELGLSSRLPLSASFPKGTIKSLDKIMVIQGREFGIKQTKGCVDVFIDDGSIHEMHLANIPNKWYKSVDDFIGKTIAQELAF